ncbi:hypothetical protein [Cellvibrio japonicus]|uniref:Uncharacterized protein n=1 Tax=Cellvibrio japonicus (strain Ueda107) TaxID=498211 RepID=B3PEL4_CELJU|nr:hypothetical protein [Cellvibrio japonicus]ACE83997.1 hypothetical protein CJA_3316 [Cellvibrio japonicus Ueda107]
MKTDRLIFPGLLSIMLSVPVLAQPSSASSAAAQAPAAESSPKTIDSATINLRTTVTGNQEQPRVLYIMPWQSPATPELDMEMLGSQQDAVFGHVEREELLRNLEAAGELDSDKSPE